jgi:AraC-like DNA-binding protein
MAKPREPGAALLVERGADLQTRERMHQEPALLLPLRRSAVTFRSGSSEERLDRSRFVVVPRRLRYTLSAESTAPDVATISLLAGGWELAEREYRPYLEADTFAAVTSRLRFFPRTRWVDELVHRYLFERDVCHKDTSFAARFLECELVKEVYFLGKETLEGQARASLAHEGGDIARSALAWLDQRLFDPFSLPEMARHCGTSESTLLRAFRKETGSTPAEYQRQRRLDEAHLLLVSGRFSVGEVAQKVGYGNLAAFTVAFGRKFGHPPSEARSDLSTARLLPPSGQPPRSKNRTRAG